MRRGSGQRQERKSESTKQIRSAHPQAQVKIEASHASLQSQELNLALAHAARAAASLRAGEPIYARGVFLATLAPGFFGGVCKAGVAAPRAAPAPRSGAAGCSPRAQTSAAHALQPHALDGRP